MFSWRGGGRDPTPKIKALEQDHTHYIVQGVSKFASSTGAGIFFIGKFSGAEDIQGGFYQSTAFKKSKFVILLSL